MLVSNKWFFVRFQISKAFHTELLSIFFWILKVEAVCTSEKSVTFTVTTQPQLPEENI